MKQSPAIQIEGISKKYFINSKKEYSIRGTISNLFKRNESNEFWALQDIDLEVEKGSTMGLIGRNGSGKSTLLKILSKVTHPTTGKATLHGSVSSLVEIGTGFHPELTGRENIFFNGALLGMNRKEVQQKLDRIIDFSEIEQFIDTPVKRYSSGMYVRLAFSIAAHLNSDILLLDEVLAVGDEKFQQKCMGKMNEVTQDEGRTIVFVSHDLHAIRNLCEQSVYLDQGQIIDKGPTEQVIQNYRGRSFDQLSKKYEKGPLKSVSIAHSDVLVVKAEYDFKEDSFVLPYFEIEIRNEFGQAIIHSSPTQEGVELGRYPIKGTVNIEINNPIFNIGRFDVSIRFGNGKEILIIDDDALHFELNRQSQYQTNAMLDASVEYRFS